jgi:hypothetical protein
MKKQIKRNIKKHQHEEEVQTEEVELSIKDEGKKLAIILSVVALVMFAMYLFTGYFVTEDLRSTDEPVVEPGETEDTVVDYNERVILAGETFTRGEGDYYVFFYDATDSESSQTFLELSNDETLNKPIFFVDLNNGFNSSYYNVGEESNTNPTDASELSIGSVPTFLEFEGGELISYTEGIEAMLSIATKQNEGE